MKYQPREGDALPAGFWDASAQEREEFWDTRARFQLLKAQAQRFAVSLQKKRSDNYWQNLMAEIHRTNEDLGECRHRKQVTVTYPETEYHGVVLDGGKETRCVDCNKILTRREVAA